MDVCLRKAERILAIVYIVQVNGPTLLLTVWVVYSTTQFGLKYSIFLFEKFISKLLHPFLKIRVRKITFPLVKKLMVTFSSIICVIYNFEIWQRLLCMSRVDLLPSTWKSPKFESYSLWKLQLAYAQQIITSSPNLNFFNNSNITTPDNCRSSWVF